MSGGFAHTVKDVQSNRYLIHGVVGRFMKVKRLKQSIGQSRLVIVLEENNEIC